MAVYAVRWLILQIHNTNSREWKDPSMSRGDTPGTTVFYFVS